MFMLPGAAAADTVTTTCGSSVTGDVGDTVVAKTLLGPVNLGTIGTGTQTLTKTLTSGLTNLVCSVTATGKAVTSPVNELVEKASEAAEPVEDAVGGILPGGGGVPPEGGGPGGTPPEDGGGGGGSDEEGGSNGGNAGTPPPNSAPTSGISSYPYNFGYAPMRDYSAIPYANAGLFSPAPGLRYGGIPGYSPDFGILGQAAEQDQVQNAGSASQLPSHSGGSLGDVGLPGLLGVLALAGASAGLVRTWVLRRALTN